MFNLKALKKSYRKYVKIQNKRIGKTGNRFYAKMAEAIYEATEKALDPSINHMHIVPAQTGSGKSIYMGCMAAALCEVGYSVAIVAKTINQCHKIYIKVAKLLKQPRVEIPVMLTTLFRFMLTSHFDVKKSVLHKPFC